MDTQLDPSPQPRAEATPRRRGGLVALLLAAVLGGAALTAPSASTPADAIFSKLAVSEASVKVGSWPGMTLVYRMSAFGCDATKPITLGTAGTTSGTVDWGDGTSQALSANPTHQFPAAGTYTVNVIGTFTAFGTGSTRPVNSECLDRVTFWENTNTTNLSGAFHGATNLTTVSKLPPSPTRVDYMFTRAEKFNSSIAGMNTSQVTSMRSMFEGAVQFNQPVTTLNTANVTDMSSMFSSAVRFNQSVGSFNVAKVTDMSFMFNRAYVYNQPFTGWTTTNLTNMNSMFAYAQEFNSSVAAINTAKVTDMGYAFQNARVFNQPLSTWNTASVRNMQSMFGNAAVFNQPLNSWNTANVTNMNNMFSSATVFNQPLNLWNTAKVMDMAAMFSYSAMNNNISAWVVSQKPINISFTNKTTTEWPMASRPKFLN